MPLTHYMRKVGFEWTIVASKIFELLKKNMLTFIHFKKVFQVYCNAYNKVIYAMFYQEGKHIAYFSEKSNESKQKYSIYDQESYVVI